jgi:hypothetical protein
MPIKKEILDAIARTYVAMTSIRGRRVHRLVMREFSRFDHVLAVAAEDGTPGLLALAEDGRAAVCRTDGRGPAVAVAQWARLEGVSVTMSYDLTKDSLPVVSWTLWDPSFAHVAGAPTIARSDLPYADHSRMTEVLRRFAG